ncbi:holo-ACP synthase [Oceanivirga miroungae]|uniref:Holo-[acyl-carrier-protein] synthase n=1 Tax=Oceanivirga miroungae TaxID=1130046 RepID=A0A6I8M8D1_9FUSO|nr:holo-ACP synthase [Oceanivirga miroungae]VWL85762.1 holo-(acyl-carrier-protein) synthase [Oceanivirga miroungae]
MQIGVDIVDVDRIKQALLKEGFKEKVFTQKEISYCESKFNKYESYAARFAAKEAVAKALKKGFRNISFLDIEVLNDEYGAPYINYKDCDIKLSLSHEKTIAIAMVLIEGKI